MPNAPVVSAPRRGQGLMEAVIAIGIILVTVFASTTLIITTIQASRAVRQRLAAINLARESIEVARAIRDSNWLSSAAWSQGWTGAGPGFNVAIPVLDPGANPLRWSVTTGVPDFIDADPTGIRAIYLVGGYYRQAADPGTLPASKQRTPYERLLYVTKVTDDLYELQSEVHWDDRGNPREIVVTEQLSNWHP